jgi:hypothetical protein
MNLWAMNLKDVPGQIQTDRANLACQPVSNGNANHPSLLHDWDRRGRLQHQSPSAPWLASSRAFREAPPAKADILSIFLHSGASMTILQSLTYGGPAWRS